MIILLSPVCVQYNFIQLFLSSFLTYPGEKKKLFLYFPFPTFHQLNGIVILCCLHRTFFCIVIPTSGLWNQEFMVLTLSTMAKVNVSQTSLQFVYFCLSASCPGAIQRNYFIFFSAPKFSFTAYVVCRLSFHLVNLASLAFHIKGFDFVIKLLLNFKRPDLSSYPNIGWRTSDSIFIPFFYLWLLLCVLPVVQFHMLHIMSLL